MNILVHGTILGYGGIANHTRDFTKNLSKYHNIKFRNFNLVDLKDWKGYTGPDILKNAEHLESIHHQMLYQQTLMDGDFKDFPLSGYDDSFVPDFHLIMAEVNHYYYYEDYDKPVIAYFFWETTNVLPEFKKVLHRVDYIWVPSEWQKNILIEDGIDEKKIFVVNSGIDSTKFYPKERKNEKFTLLHIGTWEYRKSTYEMVKSFVDVFGENSDVVLKLGIHNKLRYQDNPEETFKKFGLKKSDNIIFLPTLSEDEYINEIRNADLYLSCSRGEGWNLPLIQAMACGVPSIYSKCGGQLEFTKGDLGLGININGVKNANEKLIINGNEYYWESLTDYKPNRLYEPDYNQFTDEIKKIYDSFLNGNFSYYIDKALKDSMTIHRQFNWNEVINRTNIEIEKIKNKHMSNIYYLIHSNSFGDTLAATPTLRYLSKSHGKKINVVTYKKDIFINNPYVNSLFSFDEFNKLKLKDIIKYESHTYAGKKDGNGIEKKFSHIDIRQLHAMDLGFQLPNEDLEYDFFPRPLSLDIDLPEEYVVLHVTTNWPNRTWDYENWLGLIEWLKSKKIFTVLVGAGYKEIVHQSIGDGPLSKECPMFDDYYGLDLTNKGNMDDMFWVINGAKCIVTMDSGPLHLASCTDTHIIQLGSAINPAFKRFYRNGDWKYKYHFVGGSCTLFCNTNLHYNVKEWGDINSVPPQPNCLENKPTFECHPPLENVINKIKDIVDINKKNDEKRKMKFGIYTSFYNCEEFIESAFNNVENINYENFEWHITDDFSIDKTKELVLKRLEKSPLKNKIKYYEQSEKKEMYWKPNVFFDETFEWIILVDADDDFDNNFLNIYNDFLNDKDDVTLVSSDFLKINNDDNSLHSISYVLNDEKISKKIDRYHPKCDYLNNISYSCFGHLRGFKNVIDSFDVDDMLACAEDSYHIFWSNSYGKYLHIPRPLYKWKLRENSESHSKVVPPNFNGNFDISLNKLKENDGGIDKMFNDIYIETSTLGSTYNINLKGKKVSLWSRQLTSEQKNKLRRLYYDVDLKFNDITSDIHVFSLNFFDESTLDQKIKSLIGKKIIFYYQNNKNHFTNEEKDYEIDYQLKRYTNVIGNNMGYSWWTYIRHFIVEN